MLTTVRSAVAATLMAGALLAPLAAATDAAAASCARHSTGVCKANAPPPPRGDGQMQRRHLLLQRPLPRHLLPPTESNCQYAWMSHPG